mmetsp:Transcript_77746/g.215998  ORF Transcript_77746/g.215998 Transcript_77746/m.215998 type:complete len:213 (-) Transcript_77746:183-821(-)|eukprot:CAMPEP_0117504454 /NCGR_PEP_ID=MMETSP0784-20121206/24857_1 /TAXON_ID=39447 /ORGANISM="" /LENGTH=212 /DNA_ID=CAMNT_0005299809 /DNA_START=52 /DNA_END=690 /DNA_ORIENTATION=+
MRRVVQVQRSAGPQGQGSPCPVCCVQCAQPKDEKDLRLSLAVEQIRDSSGEVLKANLRQEESRRVGELCLSTVPDAAHLLFFTSSSEVSNCDKTAFSERLGEPSDNEVDAKDGRITLNSVAAKVKSRKRSKHPGKNAREAYRTYCDKIKRRILRDPQQFDVTAVKMPPFIRDSDAMRFGLLQQVMDTISAAKNASEAQASMHSPDGATKLSL